MSTAGSLIHGFIGAHHSSPGPSQVAYQSEHNEFGWTWFDSPGQTLEGMHRCAVLLQVQKDAAYLRISVDLITDWRQFGLWVKPYSFVVAIAAPESPPRT